MACRIIQNATMKKLILSLLAVSGFLIAAAQETRIEDPNAETRTVKAFRSIRVTDGIDVYLTQSTEDKVVVSASRDEYRSRLKTEVEDGQLKIYYDRESFSDWTSTGKKLKVYISFKTLDKLTAHAGSFVKAEAVIKEDVLSLYLQSGAAFKGKIEARKLIVESESGARVTVSGSVGTFNVHANSGGKVEAYTLSAGKADIRSTTGAKIEVTVNDEMKLFSSTGGSIYYKGAAKISEVGTNVGSIIRRKDD